MMSIEHFVSSLISQFFSNIFSSLLTPSDPKKIPHIFKNFSYAMLFDFENLCQQKNHILVKNRSTQLFRSKTSVRLKGRDIPYDEEKKTKIVWENILLSGLRGLKIV